MHKSNIQIIKNTGEREFFDPEKLIDSLRDAGADKLVIEKVVKHIEDELHDGMTTRAIYDHAFQYLKKLQRPVAARYSLKKAIAELGPTGFPFEDYVARIFSSRGYKTLTDQMVLGSCVPHEVDIVAWNKEKLIMCEVKFHNETSPKTDLKVALYVKARFDDLKANIFDYGHERRLDEGWLITNTKFTETAIHYGECYGLKMVGWDYPKKGNLQQFIEDQELHPITCLTTLTSAEKTDLLANKIVLCRELLENHHHLFTHLPDAQKRLPEILEEINYLTGQK
ncbi:MAG TPA: ATP cone domain-containing protein [Candidatus Paceibacterota bacterium]|nr:ATP cone domain-containing protein [Candidatus Paceibacterota bacterium]